RPLRDEGIRRLRRVVARCELALAPPRDGAHAHCLRPELLLPGGDVAVRPPRHADLLLAEELEALLEADRRYVGVEVALLLEIGKCRVEARELRVGEIGLADHRRLELVDRVEVLLADEREEPGASVAVLVTHPERGDA